MHDAFNEADEEDDEDDDNDEITAVNPRRFYKIFHPILKVHSTNKNKHDLYNTSFNRCCSPTLQRSTDT